ncbi:MAG: hypothetical protein LQ342_000025 [Letrouitia transgressa]|nr:MAG: hypothetical protein LQ342_000025 [Letrouitia transgressa]
MPDKPLTVLTYAASASLAAAALVYLFSPNQLIDGDSTTTSSGTRKKGVVGLANPANDCFINSILQSLAGLGNLRLYLIREVHRRQLDEASIYSTVPERDDKGKEVDVRKLSSLQQGEVTQGLKSMIDQLNERPICRKTISAQSFVRVLEQAFDTRISKAQQDAQELLQIVAERLSEEYHAGKQARRRARGSSSESTDAYSIRDPKLSHNGQSLLHTPESVSRESSSLDPLISAKADDSAEEDGFPLEGRTEARVECQHCHFMPQTNSTSFVMLNLMVPQKGSTTLNECFDAHFKTEFIDDYKCDKCRLTHALETLEEEMTYASSEEQKNTIQRKMNRIKKAIEEDPEKPPEQIKLPGVQHAPKRRIARHAEITQFPKVLVLHLSRSMFHPRSSSQKNSAKVSFPERLQIGGILQRKFYKLLGMVTHKGTHSSGHYESFRRQHLYPPRSNPHVQQDEGPYSLTKGESLALSSPSQSLGAPYPSPAPSPTPASNSDNRDDDSRSATLDLPEGGGRPSLSTATPSPETSSTSLSPPSSRPSSGSDRSLKQKPKTNPPKPADTPTTILPPSRTGTQKQSPAMSVSARFRRKRASSDRWWRISDDKVRECRTSEVLGMQRDVYMLFYEMEGEC